MADGVIELTSDNFDATVLENEQPVLVDFWAEWCGPCRMVAPVVAEIAQDRDDIVVGKLDVDAHAAIAQRYNIQGIPFIGLFRHGKLDRHVVGAMPRAQIEAGLGLT